MKPFLLSTLIVLFASASGGCSTTEYSPDVQGDIEYVKMINVGQVNSMTKRVYLIRSMEEAQSLPQFPSAVIGEGGADAAKLPTVFDGIDFSTESVVVVALGRFNTTGYSVGIESLVLEGDELKVTVSTGAPEQGSMVGMAITYPNVAMVVSKLSDSVNAVPIWDNE